jgi:hypothetical protein
MTGVIPLRYNSAPKLSHLVASHLRPSRLWIGGQQFALSLVSHAFQDACGRWTGTASRETSRRHAAHAIRWLRMAGRLNPLLTGVPIPPALREEYVGSLDWAADLLSTDAACLAHEGVHCVPGSGLKNWRTWREQRGNRTRPQAWREVRRCAFCNAQFWPNHRRQTCCGTRCAQRRQAILRRPKPERTPTPRPDAYASYVAFAANMGVVPLNRQQWGVLCG